MLNLLNTLVFKYRPMVYAVQPVMVLAAILGMMRLKPVGYIVDDIPKKDKLYTDLKFFEKNFKGVMPLEIVIDTKKEEWCGEPANAYQAGRVERNYRTAACLCPPTVCSRRYQIREAGIL